MAIELAVTCKFLTATGVEEVPVIGESSARLALDMAYNAEHRGSLPLKLIHGASDVSLAEAVKDYTELLRICWDDVLPKANPARVSLSKSITRQHISYAIQHMLPLVRSANYNIDPVYNGVDDIARVAASIAQQGTDAENSPLILGIADGLYATTHLLKTRHPHSNLGILSQCARSLGDVLTEHDIYPDVEFVDVVNEALAAALVSNISRNDVDFIATTTEPNYKSLAAARRPDFGNIDFLAINATFAGRSRRSSLGDS